MTRKLYKLLLLLIIVCAGIIGYRFYQQYQNKNMQDNLRIANILHPHKKSKPSQQVKSNKKLVYSNNEWLIMGYMAYARHNYEQSRDVYTTKKLVKDVKEDFQSGALKAKKEDVNEYILSNKFGSVNGYVKEQNVQITGDGNFVTNKEKLIKMFYPFKEEIKQMSLMIK